MHTSFQDMNVCSPKIVLTKDISSILFHTKKILTNVVSKYLKSKANFLFPIRTIIPYQNL